MPISPAGAALSKIIYGTTPITRVYAGTSLVYDANATAVITPATVRSVTAASIPYNQTSKTVAKPTGTTAGDLLLLVMHADYGAATAFTVPTGFTTLLTKELAANGDKHVIGYKIAGSSEPASYTIGVPTDADVRADLLCIRDVDASESPTLASFTSPSSATVHTAPSVTPPSSDGLLVVSASLSSGSAGQTFNWTVPSGMTERTDAATNGYVTQTVATQPWASSNTTGTRAFGLTTSSAAAQALTAAVVIPSSTGSSGPVDNGYQASPTNGSGGTYTSVQRNVGFTDAAGTSSVYHIDPTAASASKAAPLVIHLHGDGYQEYTNYSNGVTTSVAYDYMDVVKAHGAIGVIPRTPDTTSGTWWTLDTPRVWLAALIADLKNKFNVDAKRIFYSGFSGGAEHITYNMMADHHTLMVSGGAMILGGGGAEGITLAGTPTDTLKNTFPMRWFVGENDVAGATEPADYSARDAATGGESFYRNAGFTKTSVALISGTAHTDSEPYGPYYLNEVMNESNTIHGLPPVTVSGVTVPPATTTGYTPVNSAGSGGSFSDAITTNRSFTDSAGTTGRYRFWGSHIPTANRSSAMPLVIHLHGDGAYEYDNPTTWTSPQYMQVAKDIGAIGLIPEAMDLEFSLRSWWSGTRGANWVANLIVEMMRLYPIDKRQVYLSGFSGGAVIIAEDIMARHHAKFLGGGAMLLGGGQSGPQSGTYSSQLLRDFPMRWHVGTNDTAANASDGYDGRAAAEEGEATYRARGFNTALTYIQGENHEQSEDNGPAAFRALVNVSRTIYGFPTI